jgi:hypothetical protein
MLTAVKTLHKKKRSELNQTSELLAELIACIHRQVKPYCIRFMIAKTETIDGIVPFTSYQISDLISAQFQALAPCS